jgi:hypothetical protein
MPECSLFTWALLKFPEGSLFNGAGMISIIFRCESYASKGEGSQEKPDCPQKVLGAMKHANS